jgi:purine-nucleoside/S-methyl-5'-thioadenosine phosphorylase / adenosine deaminase
MTVPLIEWDVAGPYKVAFSTREGGVSEGAFESLNLGLLTHDDPSCVEENRRRLCAAVGADASRLAMNRQAHGATVNRAAAGGRGREGDGLWTDEHDLPLLKLTADCLPIALVRTNGSAALALLHAGWRGLLEGVVAAGVSALGRGTLEAVVGPGIGPCCYEVGDDVRSVFGTAEPTLDLKAVARARLQAAGVAEVHDCGLCTSCDERRFFSHRRDHGVTGRQAGLAWRS